MEEKTFKKQLSSYCKRVGDWKTYIKGTRYNKEENTMIKFVVPFFNLLGWDHLTREMEFEYFVGSGVGLSDIALYIEKFEIPKILVEVKPIQNNFVEKYPTKIFKYISRAKVKFGIALNGKELILYDNYRVRHNYRRGSRLLTLKANDFVDYCDVVSLFSKNSVKSGRLDKFAKFYHSNFYEWRKPQKKGNSLYDEYVLRLAFARHFLKRNH